MISFHRVSKITARISSFEVTNWVELTLHGALPEETTTVTLYFTSRNEDPAEERRFAHELAEAINGLLPIRNFSPEAA